MTINDMNAIDPWIPQMDWELRYAVDRSTASEVIGKMIELGFTIIAPPMPPFAVRYNGIPVYRCYMREGAEAFIQQLGNQTGYDITERN